MARKWFVVWKNWDDPQFDTCSVPTSKKAAKKEFEIMQGAYLAKIVKVKRPNGKDR